MKRQALNIRNMKRFLGMLLFVLLGAAGSLQAQIASFSFAGPSTVSGWTNISGDPHLAVQTAPAGGITLSSVSTANWSPNGNGNCAVNSFGVTSGTYFPAAVMSNSWIQYNGTNNNLALYNALLPQIKLSGLNPDSVYILRMTGSNVDFQGATQYTVAGSSVAGSQNLTTYNNASQGVTFQAVAPDSTGAIRVYVSCPSGLSGTFVCLDLRVTGLLRICQCRYASSGDFHAAQWRHLAGGRECCDQCDGFGTGLGNREGGIL